MVTDDYVILAHLHKLSMAVTAVPFPGKLVSWLCDHHTTTSNLSSSPTLPTPLPLPFLFSTIYELFVYYIIYLCFMSIGSPLIRNVNFIKMSIFVLGSDEDAQE